VQLPRLQRRGDGGPILVRHQPAGEGISPGLMVDQERIGVEPVDDLVQRGFEIVMPVVLVGPVPHGVPSGRAHPRGRPSAVGGRARR
jgi:hypothetical protein